MRLTMRSPSRVLAPRARETHYLPISIIGRENTQ
jgi:hypothetical protein